MDKITKGKTITQYDLMRQSEDKEEDALIPEEISELTKKSKKEDYFDFYDDIKISIKEDW